MSFQRKRGGQEGAKVRKRERPGDGLGEPQRFGMSDAIDERDGGRPMRRSAGS